MNTIDIKSLSDASDEPQFRIVEIFKSLQGEGYNTGMPSVFVRLGRCNLSCKWCDTNFEEFEYKPLSEVLAAVGAFDVRNIILTGGEPSVHPRVEELVAAFKARGYFMCIESNGLARVPVGIDFIAISPKYCYKGRYEQAVGFDVDELRIVVDSVAMLSHSIDDFMSWAEAMASKFPAKHRFLSPLELEGQMNILQTIETIGKLNAKGKQRWALSLQTHKLAGIE